MSKKLIIIVLSFIAVLVSIFLAAPYFTNIETFSEMLMYIDSKIGVVMSLTALTTAVSTAITAVPGDFGESVALQLTGFSNEFLIILIGLYFEKYFLIICNFVAWYYIIPFTLILNIVRTVFNLEFLKQIIFKLVCFSLLIVLTIPTSINLSILIDDIYEISTTELENTGNEIIDESNNLQEQDNTNDESTNEDEGFFNGIFNGFNNFISDSSQALEDTFNSLTGGVSDVVEKGQNLISDLVEAVAIMIITSCVIPIIVFFVFFWGIKSIFGIQYNLPSNGNVLSFINNPKNVNKKEIEASKEEV